MTTLTKDKFFNRRLKGINGKAMDLVLREVEQGNSIKIMVIYAHGNEFALFDTHPHDPNWVPHVDQLRNVATLSTSMGNYDQSADQRKLMKEWHDKEVNMVNKKLALKQKKVTSTIGYPTNPDLMPAQGIGEQYFDPNLFGQSSLELDRKSHSETGFIDDEDDDKVDDAKDSSEEDGGVCVKIESSDDDDEDDEDVDASRRAVEVLQQMVKSTPKRRRLENGTYEQLEAGSPAQFGANGANLMFPSGSTTTQPFNTAHGFEAAQHGVTPLFPGAGTAQMFNSNTDNNGAFSGYTQNAMFNGMNGSLQPQQNLTFSPSAVRTLNHLPERSKARSKDSKKRFTGRKSRK